MATRLSAPSLSGESTTGIPSKFAGAGTGIGSLPFTSSAQAIRTIGEHCAEIPFWPQLPQLSEQEGIIGQGLGILADFVEPRNDGYGYEVRAGHIDAVMDALHSSSGVLTAKNATGFYAFEEALRSGVFESAAAVKGQIEGPVTLAAYLFHRGRPFLADPALFAAVAFHISQIACWQIQRLKAFNRPVLIFVDEPALCLGNSVANGVSQDRRLSALSAIFDDVRAHGAFSGLHCCAAYPFSRMCLAKPDILSFDAHQGLEQFFADEQALEFLRNGGWAAYGMIPTLADLTELDAASIFGRWLMAASIAGDPQEFAQRALITATCGLGLVDPGSVVASFQLVQRTGGLIRRLAGVEE